MKILFMADLHIGGGLFDQNYSGKNGIKGLNEAKDCLEEVHEKAVLNNVDFIIALGDIFHRRHPLPDELNLLAHFSNLARKSKIPLYMITGNHELPRIGSESSPLSFYETLSIEGITAIEKPALRILKKGNESLVMSFLPYPTAESLISSPFVNPDKKTKDDKATLTDMFTDLVSEMSSEGKKLAKENDTLSVLAGHFLVTSADSGLYDNIARPNDIYAEPDFIKNIGYDAIFLGHIHDYMRLSSNPPLYYTGSLFRTSYTRKKQDKGVVIADFDTKSKSLSTEFIPLSKVRPLIQIEVSVKSTESLQDKLAEAFLTLPADGTQYAVSIEIFTDDPNLQIKPNEIRQIKGHPEFFILSLFPQLQQDTSINDKDIRDTLDFKDPYRVLSVYLNERQVEQELSERLLSLFSEIIKDNTQ